MNEKKSRQDWKGVIIIAVLGIGGLALVVAGMSLCKDFKFNFAGVLMAASGASLIFYALYYHYKRDYVQVYGRKSGFLAYLAVTAVSALLGVLVVHFLFR